jgi:hypothetical protein
VTDGRNGSLEAVIETAAADLDDVKRQEGAAGLEWSTRGTVFAAAAGDQAEFRLALPVVAAALRTPDTTRSPRGADWVAFAPAALDEHALDRATAWLASAWRRVSADA